VTDPLSTSTERRDAARGQLRQRFADTKERLSPASLKQDLINSVRDRAEGVADAARERPVAFAGILAATALFLLRKPLIGVLKRLSKEK
jgi:hypothetical protein